jgi:acetoin utilization deacetylase AcuC-like enzyme
MTTLRAYYSDVYAPKEVISLHRLALVANAIKRRKLAQLTEPGPFDAQLLQGLHDIRYVAAFMDGKEPLASSQGLRWSMSIRDATLAMLAGQIEGARHALQHGIAMNIARGFHHAVRECGSGFCPFNGLALVAHCMPEQRILVLDCDEHGGNGTEEFAAELPNLYNVSIFGTRFGCRGGTRSWAFKVRVLQDGFDHYLEALEQAAALVAAHRPDLIIYQAGADCHLHDPKSMAKLSTRQLIERDDFVFRMAHSLGIPLLFVVAGGYQRVDHIVTLNLNTVRAAHRVYVKASPRLST